MSLAETQEIMATLKEIIALLGNVEFKTEKLNADLPKTKETGATFRQVERLALRWLAIGQKMGLPDNVNQAISSLARLLVMMQMINISLNMLTKGGTFGVLMGITGLIGTAISIPSIVEGY